MEKIPEKCAKCGSGFICTDGSCLDCWEKEPVQPTTFDPETTAKLERIDDGMKKLFAALDAGCRCLTNGLTGETHICDHCKNNGR